MSFFKFKPNDHSSFQIATATPPIPNKYNKNNQIDFSLNKNVEVLKDLLHFPDSNDLIFRFFELKINNQKYNALTIFYDGLDDYLIKQLIKGIKIEVPQNKSIIKNKDTLDIKNIIVGNLLAQSQVSFVNTYDDIINHILHGDCALIVDTLDSAIICDVKNLPSRSIEKAQNEMTIKGPSEAFVENFRKNTALIRKFVKDENLIFETMEIGSHSKTKCAIAYITDITNDSLIAEVKRRLGIDYLISSRSTRTIN